MLLNGDSNQLVSGCHHMCVAYCASCDKTLEYGEAFSYFKNARNHLNGLQFMPQLWVCVHVASNEKVRTKLKYSR